MHHEDKSHTYLKPVYYVDRFFCLGTVAVGAGLPGGTGKRLGSLDGVGETAVLIVKSISTFTQLSRNFQFAYTMAQTNSLCLVVRTQTGKFVLLIRLTVLRNREQRRGEVTSSLMGGETPPLRSVHFHFVYCDAQTFQFVLLHSAAPIIFQFSFRLRVCLNRGLTRISPINADF